MYREKPSEPLVDVVTGATFVARPFLHFKDMHSFDVSMNQKTVRLSCDIIFNNKQRRQAYIFGDTEKIEKSTPIYAIHFINAYDGSDEKIEMSGPERKEAFDEILPLFGEFLLRFINGPVLFVLPSFNEDYFKSFAELQMEALQSQVEWAHTYILQSRILMKRFRLDTLAELRTKLNLDPIPNEDACDFDDRVEAAIESFAPDEYFAWFSWAEQTVDNVIQGVRELLRPEARETDLYTLLFADFLSPNCELPGHDEYVAPRFRTLVLGLQLTKEDQ